ncbi:hypothetical protein KPL70_020009 [Citrus sinensis]|nr:hypothetical protein KPL70_020009 [Citrus sinensis]
MAGNGELEETNVPLLEDLASKVPKTLDDSDQNLPRRVWMESKKLWYIDGPTIFSRLVSYSMLAITLAFAGHLGDLELAAISIVNNVVIGFDFGLFGYVACGGCPLTWTGFWEFIKLSAASGVMLLWDVGGVRIANELVAGNGKGDKFATAVSVVASIIIEVSSSGY